MAITGTTARRAATAALVEKEVIELYRWNNPGEVISDGQLRDFARGNDPTAARGERAQDNEHAQYNRHA